MSELPIHDALPELLSALKQHNRCVLQAPPGAGKSTVVPLELWQNLTLGEQKILLLEPRRLAARAVAMRMAETLREPVGQTVGYRMRMDVKVSAATRIEVVTDGILTRLLQSDPELSGVGAVIFDEFHERSLQADLGLALCLDVQEGLREDLKLLLMSATLDGEGLSKKLDAPLVVSEGRQYPVETVHLALDKTLPLERAVAKTLPKIVAESEGDVLLFAPSMGNIRKLQTALQGTPNWQNIDCLPLHGSLTETEQRRALAPAATGRRKVVLSSAIAETSLTLPGVTTVVDMGLDRRAVYDPNSGMTKLQTLKASQASSEQRAGRAGRVGPGRCFRLWPSSEQRIKHAPVEMLETDLTALLLELRQWGVSHIDDVFWLDSPPAVNLQVAESLLQQLGALDVQGRPTAYGKQLNALGTHPRIAHMLSRAAEWGQLPVAATLAALLQEGPRLIRQCGGDIGEALSLVMAEGRSVSHDRLAVLKRVRQAAKNYQRRLKNHGTAQEVSPGTVLALAYPDRVAQRRGTHANRYKLSNGKGAAWRDQHPLCVEPYLVVADLDGQGKEALIHAAMAVDIVEILTHFPEAISHTEQVQFNTKTQAVDCVKRELWRHLVVSEKPHQAADAEAMTTALLDGVRRLGLSCLNWDVAVQQLCLRVEWLKRLEGERGDFPDWQEETLLKTLETWLGPYCQGMSRIAHLQKLNLAEILSHQLAFEQRNHLDQQLPTTFTVPTGSRLSLNYTEEEVILAVRLQEMYGCKVSPSLASGRLPVTLHLLTPAQRVTQITKDLATFWAGSYKEVAKDLKGRYPKHYWPDNPAEAQALRGTKKQLKSD